MLAARPLEERGLGWARKLSTSRLNLICRLILAAVSSVAAYEVIKHAPPVTNIVNVQSADHQLVPDDCDKTVQISGGFYAFRLPSATGFREGCHITVANGDGWAGGRGKLLDGFPSGFSNAQDILWPDQAGSIQVINRKWAAISHPGRPKLPDGRVNFYSDYDHGKNAGSDCLAPGNEACKSADHTLYLSCNEFEFSGTDRLQTRMYVNMAENTVDREWIHYACPPPPGGQGGAHLVLLGGVGSKLSVQGLDAIGVFVNATLAIQDVTLSTDKGSCLRADFGGEIFFAGATFGDCDEADMEARNDGRIYLQANYTINGRAKYHRRVSSGGQIVLEPPGKEITITLGEKAAVSDWADELRNGVVHAARSTEGPDAAFTLSAN
jgi:hypothetical protein